MKWSNKITKTNRYKKFLHEKIWIAFLKSHFTSRQDAKHVINIFSHQIVLSVFIAIMHIFQKNSLNRAYKKKLLRARKFIIVMFSKKNNSQTKRLFSFIIACFLRSTSTIQSFREVRRLKRLILRDFHYTHQKFIIAR